MILCKKNLTESRKSIFYVKRAIFGFCVFYLKGKMIEIGKVNCVVVLGILNCGLFKFCSESGSGCWGCRDNGVEVRNREPQGHPVDSSLAQFLLMSLLMKVP